ncbi:MAG: porin [Planctomycetales bacterium]
MLELQGRIEALEQQNQALAEQLQSRVHVLPANAVEPSSVPVSDIHSVVDEYLRGLNEEQQPKEQVYEIGENLGMSARWQNGGVAGFYVETPDKAFRVHVGGRTQMDFVFLSADQAVENAIGPLRDGANFRRARFAVDGTLWEVVDFWMEYDFLNTTNVDPTAPASQANVINTPAPTDLWVTFTQLPAVGNARIGNQKPPLSFERLTSSRFLNFLERSTNVDGYVNGLDNGFRPGLQIFNQLPNERATWAVGVFKNNTTVFGWNQGDGEYDVTGRITALPWYEHDGRCLIHVGVGASHRDTDEGRVRYRARTLLRNGPSALHGTLAQVRALADDETIVIPELVIVNGPFSLESEYFAVWATDTRFPTAAPVQRGRTFFQGAYATVGWFLTGEHRRYDTKYPRFGRVFPIENFFLVDGCRGPVLGRGAWQVAARYDWMDLEDGGVAGGEIHAGAFGLNWFLNPNMKIQWNYIYEHLDDAAANTDGDVHGFGTRLHIDF